MVIISSLKPEKICYKRLYMKKAAALLSLLTTLLIAQDLQTTLGEVLQTNPSIQERLKNYNAYKQDIDVAKAGYYPKLDLKLGAGYEKTTRTDLSGAYRPYNNGIQSGVVHNLGYHVYQTSLVYTHNVFEGFGTKYAVQGQEFRTLSAAYSYIEQVNAVASDTAQAYLEFLKNSKLLGTAKENVKIDEMILGKVKKLYNSGLTTLSEVNKVESSLALARANLVVQENSLKSSAYNLEKLLGRHLKPNELEEVKLKIELPKNREKAIETAFANNPSLLVSDYNIKQAEAAYKQSESPFYPRIDIEASANYNKNLSAVAGNDDSYKGMVYLSYNFFSGFGDEATKKKNISKIYQENEIKNKLKRDVVEKINLAWTSNIELQKQLERLKEYKDFSFKTLKLYAKEYDLGRRSLLDLLTAQNDYINAKAQIISIEYALLESQFKILDAMGTLVQTVMGDTKSIYSNVNLAGKKVASNEDTLPVHYDTDNDLIVNRFDICDNSLAKDVQDIYGCKNDENVTMIKRYSWFLFEDHHKYLFEKDDFDPKALDELKKMIKQASFYGFKNLKVTIFGNAFDNTKSSDELKELSQKRADYVKKLFLDAGAKEDNIKTYAIGNTAPLYSNDDIRNNRIDIIIKKMK